MSTPRFVMERVPAEAGLYDVTLHESWEGMKGTLGGPDCGCVKCLTARWKAEWEAYLISHESHLLRGGTAVPSEFEVRRMFTMVSFNCFGVTIRGK